jgi:hypothetical protein
LIASKKNGILFLPPMEMPGQATAYDTVSGHVESLSGGVPKNLTLHGMSKIEFQPEFWNPQMLSFSKM